MALLFGKVRDPLNLSILRLSPDRLRLLKTVTSLDVFDAPNSPVLHQDGLFSTSIFGDIGTEARDFTFAKIFLKTNVFHSLYLDRFLSLKSLYKEILENKTYATWDDKTKTFVKSNELEGETGFGFFFKYWDKIEFEKVGSDKRLKKVRLVEENRSKALVDHILVQPAGLRDIEYDESGRPTVVGELNEYYKAIMSTTNNLSLDEMQSPLLDRARLTIQRNFDNISKYIEDFLSGKKGYINKKWASRALIDGTRNVASATPSTIYRLGEKATLRPDETALGLWQLASGTKIVSTPNLRKFISRFFDENDQRLIDPKTLRLVETNLKPKVVDRWTTNEGVVKVIHDLSMVSLRNQPIKIDGHYLALVYRPKNKNIFKVFKDIDKVPDWVNKDDIHPITYFELVYLSNYKNWNNFTCMVTRYPVAGEGSTYRSKVKLITTLFNEERKELDYNWEEDTDPDAVALVYPILDNPSYLDTVQIDPTRMVGLALDYDGDMLNVNIFVSKEANEETLEFLRTKESVVLASGGIRRSSAIDTINLVMHNISWVQPWKEKKVNVV